MRLKTFHMRFWGWALMLFVGLSACQSGWREMPLEAVRGDHLTTSTWKSNDYSVLFFLGPECPLCENYALNFNELYDQFQSESVQFYGIFSGTSYTNDEIISYKNEFGVKMPFYLDPDFELAHGVGATVTPEVVVLDENLNTVYRGAIDNWAVTVRKHRQVVTEYYLRDVLIALENGQKPPYEITEPVGCFIE
jgi:peroxiredoxin